jgi:hypothetical protein
MSSQNNVILHCDKTEILPHYSNFNGHKLIYLPDEPSKPGRPEAKNWDKDFVDLEWAAPKNDGGAPIEKYIIQMRDKEGRAWVDAATVPGNR